MASASRSRPGASPRLSGTWYLTPTPFDASGELDIASQARVVEAAISWGVDGLTVMGVMSEPGSLSDAERSAALRAIFGAAGGRVPIVVGCSAASPTRAASLMQEAASLGAVAAMVAAPTLTRNADLLPGYYAALHRDGGLPVLVQDEPAATGVLMPVSILLACATAAGSLAIKVEDPPTPNKIGRLRELEPSIALFGGLGGLSALSELRRGAAGTMTGFAFPEAMRAIRLAAEAGDWQGAAAIFDRFLPLIVFEAQVGVGLAIRKEVLWRRGAIAHNLTRGLTRQIDAATAAELDEILARVRVVPSILPIEAGAGARSESTGDPAGGVR